MSETAPVGSLRNVIVFVLGGRERAIELTHVREITTLGFVTEVPTAPQGISGLYNLRGAVLPVIDLPALWGAPARPARQGDAALVIEGPDQTPLALHVDRVEEVRTLRAHANDVLDTSGVVLPLLDLMDVWRRATAALEHRRDPLTSQPVAP